MHTESVSSGNVVDRRQESAELLRDLQTAFNSVLPPELAELTLYPKHLQSKIDTISEWMQRDLNTGVYKAGFAPDQETYNKNLPPVFGALNKMEKILFENKGPYVLGKDMTELDVRLYATLIRFDTVYVQHFKCNLGMIRKEYPVLNNWLKGMYWNHPEFKNTTDFKHIKENVRGTTSQLVVVMLMNCSTQRAITMSTQRLSRRWVLGRILRRATKRIGASSLRVASTCQKLSSTKRACHRVRRRCDVPNKRPERLEVRLCLNKTD